MSIKYYKLLDILNRNGMTREELRLDIKVSSATMTKISSNEIVSLGVINKICKVLQLQPGDILEYVDEGDNEDLIVRDNKASKSSSKKTKEPPSNPNKQRVPKDDRPQYEIDFERAEKKKLDHVLSVKVTVEEYPKLRIGRWLPVPDQCLLPPNDEKDWQIKTDEKGYRSWYYFCPGNKIIPPYDFPGPRIDDSML